MLDSERLERILNYGHNQGFLNVEDQVTFGFIKEREVVYTVRVDNLIFQEDRQVDLESFLVCVKVLIANKVAVLLTINPICIKSYSPVAYCCTFSPCGTMLLYERRNLMQLVERHLIKPNHELYPTLDDLTFKAKNLYNHGLYLYRQSYFEHKENPETPILSWMAIDKSLRTQGHKDVRALPSKVANAVLKNLGESISSFWKLVRLKNKGGLRQKPKLPHYLHKTEGRYPLSFNYQTFGNKRGSNNELFLCPKGINLPIPTKVANPKQVRIVPNHNNFIIEVIYNAEERAPKSTSKYAGIDLGVDNFATVTFSTQNNPLIIKGLELKSINQGYNRLIAKAQSLLPGSLKTSKSIHRLWSRRSWILHTKIHQMTAFLAHLFDEIQIEKVFIGKNINWKQNLPFGKAVKQHFTYLPYETFIEQLQYKCHLRGITVVVQEESYTSKASFLDGDDIPVYSEVENPKFSGRRIKRGLYKSGNSQLINADVNGSYNILRKGLANNQLSFNVDNPLIHPLVVKGIGEEPNDKLVRLYM